METNPDLKALEEAFALFNSTTRKMEESYRRLEERVGGLNAELAAKNRELAVTNDYLSCILESMSDGVIVVDPEGTVTTFNHAARSVLGFSAEEAIGQSFRELFGREFTLRAGPGALELRAKDGTSVPISERDAPIVDRTHEKRLGTVKVFQDLSEIEALREQVRRIDRLAAIGEMAATVAHEIRNPLGGIRGFAALLARDIEDGDPRKRLVEKILVGTASLDKVVNELLEYTRPVELRLKATGCAELLEAALGFLHLDKETVEVVTTLPPDLKVLADPDKMRQVFLNILLNAVQSLEGKGIVHVSAEHNDDYVTVAIADNGCGIPETELGKIFSPFYTTKEKGTGLGLAVAAKIVEGHGGVLEAASTVGDGTTFRITLPRID